MESPEGERRIQVSKNFHILAPADEEVYIVPCREYQQRMEALERLGAQRLSAEAFLAAAWGLVGVFVSGLTFSIGLYFVPTCPSWLLTLAIASTACAAGGASMCFWAGPTVRRVQAERLDEIVTAMHEMARRHHTGASEANHPAGN